MIDVRDNDFRWELKKLSREKFILSEFINRLCLPLPYIQIFFYVDIIAV